MTTFKCFVCKKDLPMILAIQRTRGDYDYMLCLDCYKKNTTIWNMEGYAQIIAKCIMIKIIDEAYNFKGELIREAFRK